MLVWKIVLIAFVGCVLGRPQNTPIMPPGFNASSVIQSGQNIFNPDSISNNAFPNSTQYLNRIPALIAGAIPGGFVRAN